MVAVPSRRAGLVEGEPFGFSRGEEGLTCKSESRAEFLFPALERHPKLARFTPRSGRRTMVRYLSPQELEALIKGGTKDYLIVDVRDDDYRGGNIKGAINIPSEKFTTELYQLIDDTKNASKIIFHCTLSQQRWVYLA